MKEQIQALINKYEGFIADTLPTDVHKQVKINAYMTIITDLKTLAESSLKKQMFKVIFGYTKNPHGGGESWQEEDTQFFEVRNITEFNEQKEAYLKNDHGGSHTQIRVILIDRL